MEPYSAPSRDVIKNLVNQSVHQPALPSLVNLMCLSEFCREVIYITSVKGMAEAGGGRARIDKTMAKKVCFESFVTSCVTKKANSLTPTLRRIVR